MLSLDGRLCLTPVCVAAIIIRNHTWTRTHLCLHFFNVAHNQPSGIADELKGSLLTILCLFADMALGQASVLPGLGGSGPVEVIFSYGNSYLWGGCHTARLKMASGPEG